MGNQPTVTSSPRHEDGIPYVLGEIIGKGGYGTVYQGRHRTTKEVVAIKKLNKLNLREVETLKKANHKNIVRLVDFLFNSDITYIVLEFCEHGSLDVYLKKMQPDESERMKFIIDMSAGLAYLHEIPIIHRDLKPGNVLVDKNRIAKISDFGLAKLVENEGNLAETYLDNTRGNLAYMAPEVVQKHYNIQADVFSLGLVFCSTLNDELRRRIESEPIGIEMACRPSSTYKVPSSVDSFMRDLITRMVERDYHTRPKAADVQQELLIKYQPPVNRKPPILSSKRLVAAGIAACIGVKVLLPEEVALLHGNQKVHKLTIQDFFHFTNPAVMSVNKKYKTGSIDTDQINLLIKSPGGSTKVLNIPSNAAVSDLRKRIALNSDVPEEYLQLFHRSCRIENENQIELDGIGQGSVVHVHSAGEGSARVVYEMDDSFLDPGYNYDFTNIDDGETQYKRGGYIYERPCGWYRHALRVKGQYTNDVWLGPLGNRTHSTPNEWPVSYHGSKMENSISSSASVTSSTQGVITTPSLLTVADKFAETFYFEGNKYQIALQNRVNPDRNNEHMVIIPGEDSDANAEYWFSPKQDPLNGVCDVRPYGILIRLVNELV